MYLISLTFTFVIKKVFQFFSFQSISATRKVPNVDSNPQKFHFLKFSFSCSNANSTAVCEADNTILNIIRAKQTELIDKQMNRVRSTVLAGSGSFGNHLLANLYAPAKSSTGNFQEPQTAKVRLGILDATYQSNSHHHSRLQE